MSDNHFLDRLRAVYPKAIPGHESATRLLNIFRSEFDKPPSKIMHADSICSDDINAIEYPAAAQEMLGPFQLGGLDGFPFTGLTGMGAFVHHTPEDGAVFVFHGPHIGVTKSGTIGEVLRPGQSKPSACCGAACAALAKLEAGELQPGQVDELDYQQNQLEQILLASSSRILSADNRIVEATEVIYEASAARIDQLVARTTFPCRPVVIMGAIVINGDHDVGAFVEVRHFEHLDTRNQSRRDLSHLLGT